MGSYTAAETGPNYDEVEIKSAILLADVGGACGVGFVLFVP